MGNFKPEFDRQSDTVLFISYIRMLLIRINCIKSVIFNYKIQQRFNVNIELNIIFFFINKIFIYLFYDKRTANVVFSDNH